MLVVAVRKRKKPRQNKSCICRFYNTGYCVIKKQKCLQDESCEQEVEKTISGNVESEMATYA